MALAFPPYDFSILVWIGLLPLLTVLWRCYDGFLRTFLHGWLFGLGWYSLSFWWINQVGKVFGIPALLFFGIAFFPLMSLYAILPGLWAVLTARWLRPLPAPQVKTAPGNREQTKELWNRWSATDLLSTLRCATGAASLWVCVEWLRAHGTLGFGWNSLGMALYDGLSLAQWAEYVGTSALAFIPVFTSVILWRSARRCYLYFKATGSPGRPWDFYGTVIILFALFTGGLALSKLHSPLVMLKQEQVLPLPVMAVQVNQDQRARINGDSGLPLTWRYMQSTLKGFEEVQQAAYQKAMQHPEVGVIQQLPVWVIWPESAMGHPLWRNQKTGQLEKDQLTYGAFFSSAGLPDLRRRVQMMGGVPFVLFTGVDEHLLTQEEDGKLETHGMYNSLAVIPGDFTSIITASKQHLMPFGEYIPLADSWEWLNRTYSEITGTQVGDGIHPGQGTEPLTAPVPGLHEHIGVIPAVCYEDTVGDLPRKFVRRGPQVIVNVTNDGWFLNSACGEQQARSAAFRCIELRRPMVRAANMGLTCAIAPNGAPLQELRDQTGNPHIEGSSYAVLPVDRNAGLTLYAMLGDWAVAVCAVLGILLCFAASPLRGEDP